MQLESNLESMSLQCEGEGKRYPFPFFTSFQYSILDILPDN